MYFLLILFLLIFFIFIMPVKIVVKLQNGTSNIIIFLYHVIKINIKAKNKPVNISAKKYKKPKIHIEHKFAVLKSIFSKAKKPLFKLLKHIKLDLKLKFVFGLSEPDKSAIAYGIINYKIYSLDVILKNTFKSCSSKYTIAPDLNNQHLDYCLNLSASLYLFSIIFFSLKMLPIFFKHKKYIILKGGENNGRTSNRRVNENYNG